MNFLAAFVKNVNEKANALAVQGEKISWTYQNLWDESLKVYTYLKKINFKGDFALIDGGDEVYSYAYILGSWLYGVGYLPVHEIQGQERIKQICLEGNLAFIFSTKKTWPLPAINCSERESEKYEGKGGSGEFAYLLYTSGSTGKPKGVPITWGNLSAFLKHYLNPKKYNFSSQDVFLQSYELTFDVSVFCFALPFYLGGKLVLLPEKGIKYLNIIKTLQQQQISVCSMVPSVIQHSFSRLHEVVLPKVRYSFFSGESLFGLHAKKWMKSVPNAQVYNCYGPTETTIVCSTENLNFLPESYFTSSAPLPLGAAFEGTQLLTRDGEICIAGEQVFSGYANQETNYIQVDGKKYYPSGDLGELDGEGKLIFKGRKDRQIQVNGYRVELDEIDFYIQEQLSIASKTFYLQKKGLEGIYSVLEADAVNLVELKNNLQSKLPVYALPRQILVLTSFPKLTNQKLDVQALQQKVHEMLIFEPPTTH